MTDDVLINKAAIIERCCARIDDIRSTYGSVAVPAPGTPSTPRQLDAQDALVLNLLRACEAAIDIAMHVVRNGRLGAPQDARDAFERLAASGFIDRMLATRLQAMVGFRTVAVHDYQVIDPERLARAADAGAADLRALARSAVGHA